MANNIRLLSRLFRRTDNSVITALYTHCIGRPLLVHPSLGEQLLGGYLQGAVDYESDPQPVKAGRLAIMNISGALASRPMPGPSGDGPMNYEEMSATFGELVEDSSVDAIILRLDTPGGFADGLFDFSDLIFQALGEKPVHAVVEHMAYSAGYAIASAADQIWITRTSGIGSVGAVMYHVDQSEFDKKAGVKITPIYSGARKIDFSPHFELSQEALEVGKAEVDELHQMFVKSVAHYRGARGLTAEAIDATESGVFIGRHSIDAKFADRIGTLRDALSFLAGGGEPPEVTDPEPSEEEENDMDLTEEQKAAAEAQRAKGAIAEIVMAASLPGALTAALLKADIKEDQIADRVTHAKTVRDLCDVAAQSNLAEGFVTRQTALEDVRTQLLSGRANRDAGEIDITLPGNNGRTNGKDKPMTAAEIYESRRQQVAAIRKQTR